MVDPARPVEERRRLAEIKRIIAEFDDTPWPEMNAFFYANAFTELMLAVEDLLQMTETKPKKAAPR